MDFVPLLPGPALTGLCSSCSEDPRAGHSTPSGVPPEWSRGAELPPQTQLGFFWCSPGCCWFSGLQVHIIGFCPAFYPPVPPSPSLQGSQSLHPSACIDTGGCFNQVQEFAQSADLHSEYADALKDWEQYSNDCNFGIRIFLLAYVASTQVMHWLCL